MKMFFSGFMNKVKNIKYTNIYLMGTFGIGFYRGYNNHYHNNILHHRDEDLHLIINKKIYKKCSNPLNQYTISSQIDTVDTIIDKFVYGVASGLFYYLNPMFHIIILYYTFRRIEKRMRNKPLKPNDWHW